MSSQRLWQQAPTDLYGLLGVPRDAGPDEIHEAWRTAAKRNHPDNGGDPDRFRFVHIAFLVLSDVEERAEYDRTTRPAEHSVWAADAPSLEEPPWIDSAGSAYERPALLWLFALAGLVAVAGSFVWPGFTIVTGIAVAAVVLTRYRRVGFGLLRRR